MFESLPLITDSTSFEPRLGRSVTIDQAAALLGVSRRTIYNRIRDGRLRTIRTLGVSQRVLVQSLFDTGVQAAGVFDLCVGRVSRTQPGNSTLTSEQEGHAMASFTTRNLRFTSVLCAAAFLLSAERASAQGRHARAFQGSRGAPAHRRRSGGERHRHRNVCAGAGPGGASRVADQEVSGDGSGSRGPGGSVGGTCRRSRGRPAFEQSRGHGPHGGDQSVHWRGPGPRKAAGPTASGHSPARASGSPSSTPVWRTCRSSLGRIIATLDFTDDRGPDLTRTATARTWRGSSPPPAATASTRPQGVAPGANIISLKVLDAKGRGVAGDVIEAIDWAIANRTRFNIRVINMSLGGPVTQSWRDDPLCQAVERAYRAGITVVASAGNFGKAEDGRPVYGCITSPGNSPFAITVGALNTKGTPFRSDDEVASYSSKGPTMYDHLVKPDLVAPGNKILGLAAPGSTLVREHPELVVSLKEGKRLQLSGTSMAAAVVSGAVSLVLDRQAHLSPLAVRGLLQSLCGGIRGGNAGSGTGRLNVLGALSMPQPELAPPIAGEAQVPSRLLAGGAPGPRGREWQQHPLG